MGDTHQTWWLACFQCDKVRLLLPDTHDKIIFHFISHHADEPAYINPVYIPLFLLYNSFLPTVTGEQTDCAVSLILWLCCHFEVGDQNQDGTQQRQYLPRPIKSLKSHITEEAQCHTHSVIQLTQFSYALVANTVTVQFILRLKSFLDRWSHQQPSSLLQPLLLPSIMLPVCPVLIGTFQFINHLKNLQAAPFSEV